MASLRFYVRHIKRITSTAVFQLAAIFLLLFIGFRWVLQHNHDGEAGPGPVAHPIKSVEDPSIDWSKLYYVQYVTTPEYLCNALMVWSEIEDIGSRAQRCVNFEVVSKDFLTKLQAHDVSIPLGSRRNR
jgi:hypothetical protein